MEYLTRKEFHGNYPMNIPLPATQGNKENTKLILLSLTLATFFSLSMWFSSNAVKDQISELYDLTNIDLALYSIVTIIGFALAGTLFSIFNLPDILRPRNFFIYSTVAGSIFNFLAVLSPNFLLFLVFRFLTGASIAGVYPVAMKLTASHFKENRGFSIGVMVSAVIAGSGLPYIFNLFGTPDYLLLTLLTSILSLIGGFIVFQLVTEGPYIGKKSKFSLTNLKTLLKSKSFMYANLGYFGHMWELYAAWVFVPVVLAYSYNLLFFTNQLLFFSLSSFFIFALGALGSVYGGRLADSMGRTKFNIIMLVSSGLSGVLFGFFVNEPLILLIIALFWGLTIVPDSAQYSTMITELVDESLIGTALTIQTAVGFSITLITIYLIPVIQNSFGWENSFFILSLGPIIGILAMILLRRQPDSINIANGKR
jgi:MFS family permease